MNLFDKNGTLVDSAKWSNSSPGAALHLMPDGTYKLVAENQNVIDTLTALGNYNDFVAALKVGGRNLLDPCPVGLCPFAINSVSLTARTPHPLLSRIFSSKHAVKSSTLMSRSQSDFINTSGQSCLTLESCLYTDTLRQNQAVFLLHALVDILKALEVCDMFVMWDGRDARFCALCFFSFSRVMFQENAVRQFSTTFTARGYVCKAHHLVGACGVSCTDLEVYTLST